MKKIFTLLLFVFAASQMQAAPTFLAPTTPATNFSATGSDGDKISLSWINGNGTKRIVVARKEGPVTAVPTDGIDYNASATFGSGNEIAPGEFVVANLSNNSTTVSGLQAATTYYFAVFEYNGSGSGIQYLATPTRTSGATYSAPTGQVTNATLDNITGHSMRLTWTSAGVPNLGNGRIVIAREGSPVNVNPVDLTTYTANSTFGSGTQIGNGNFVLFRGNATSVNVDGLKPGTTYYFSIFDYNGSSGLVFNINNPTTVSINTLAHPSVATSNISFSSIEGNSMSLTFTAGNGSKRLVVAKAGSAVTSVPQDGVTYTFNTIFGNGQQLAPGEFVVSYSNSTSITLTTLTPGTTYYFAVFEADGSGAGTVYQTDSYYSSSQATVSAPTVPASNLALTNVGSSSFTVNWTAGNGGKHLVIVKSGSPITTLPTDFTFYGGYANFGSGTPLGTNAYAVYSGTGNSVTVTGLAGGTTYYAAVFEYNGSTAPLYLTSAYPTASATTTNAPTTASYGLFFNGIDGNRMTASWNLGNGTKRIVVVKAGSPVTGLPQDNTSYNASSVFGNGDQLGGGEYVVMNSASGSVTVTNLLPNVVYYYAIFEYNTVNNANYYLTSSVATGNQSTSTTPTVNSSALTFSPVTGNSIKLNFIKGNGTSRIILAKAGSPVDAAPTDFTTYPNTSTFGSGTQIGTGNYVVYNSPGNTATVQGLQPDVTYYFKIFEFNGSSYPVYLTTNALSGNQATASRPSVASSAISFSSIEGNGMNVRWTAGNGARRILIGKAGSPVTAVPVDGATYSANTAFGSGTQIAPGEFVLMDNTISDATLTNLSPSTTYYFAVYEYDGTGSNTRYGTGSLSGNASTLVPPTQQSSNVLFSSIGSTSLSVNWTAGNGDRHLVVLRKGAPVDATVQNLHFYSSSTGSYTSSTLVSGQNYAVYNSAGNNLSLTGLTPGATYYFAVYDFNGFNGPVYNLTAPPTGSVTTLGPPSDAASNVLFTSISGSGTSVKISWANGSGQRRLVLVKQGSPVDALPVNNTTYTANTFFGSGDQLGTGNFAVYNGFADNVTINNLTKGPVYYVAVFEYNQFATGPMYLTTSYAQGQVNSVILPVKLTAFSGAAKDGLNLLQWTTAQEKNTAEFVVERSANGKDFASIGNVAASGNSSAAKNYSFEDKNRLPVSFYRLRIMDADGKSEYSAVIRLQSTKDEKLKVFPTLATTSVQISLFVNEKTTTLIRVVDASGKLMMQESRSVDAGMVTTTIDVSRLIAGHYFVQVQTGEKTATERFIKQ